MLSSQTNDRVTGCDSYSDRYLGSISEGNLVGPALEPKVTVLDLHAQSPIKEWIRASNRAMRAVRVILPIGLIV